ncbi:23S rRNA (pseudouridine(1915)-N(3))-methyltransferase RlmH [candidate division KSB3 bacterium]|uniref:Ribosomal RNA large subunit methyltransferase H n=1 Tax=candidate division KSB3 bacterium TaxID=2044937 RepID=A0A2G6E6V0_9BACT|nr:MAG: 23S rRNA (pseudouridine(1915)-N(3))-methyltransferase RlmH [candidate division KSB3 bacterium]PIE30246.1 MAG: 23S rRNA (pseudouridine(1915)-N(3))-methyltransferase RlmH [candidate division KSB3 bacterium]
MTITLLALGKIKDRALQRLIDKYCQRIQHYTRFEYIELSAEKRKKTENDTCVKKRESEKIQKQLLPHDFIVALDERGLEYCSMDFAKFLEKQQIRGNRKRLVFVTGGATGFSETFLRSADLCLALSKMTLPHQLCRLLFVEQLYRAFSIIAGEPYHNA